MRVYFSWKQAASMLALGLAAFFGSLDVFGQSTAGRVLGGVTDQSGAAVQGATVILTALHLGTS